MKNIVLIYAFLLPLLVKSQVLPQINIKGNFKSLGKTYFVEALERKGSIKNPSKFEYEVYYRKIHKGDEVNVTLRNIPLGKRIVLHLIDKEKSTFEFWTGFVADTTYLQFQQENNTIRVSGGGYLQQAYNENAKKLSYWKKNLDNIDETEKENYLKKCVDTLQAFYNRFKEYEFCYDYLSLTKDFFEKTGQLDTLKKLMEEGSKRYPKNFFIKLFFEEYANLEPLIIGRKISDIILTNEKEKKIHVQGLSSKYILIDFWATWCAPCIKEQRYLKENFAKFTQKGISIVAISIDEDKQKWKKFLQKANYPWINLLDTKNYRQKFGIEEIPRNILLNENREIIGKDINWEDINTLIP